MLFLLLQLHFKLKSNSHELVAHFQRSVRGIRLGWAGKTLQRGKFIRMERDRLPNNNKAKLLKKRRKNNNQNQCYNIFYLLSLVLNESLLPSCSTSKSTSTSTSTTTQSMLFFPPLSISISLSHFAIIHFNSLAHVGRFFLLLSARIDVISTIEFGRWIEYQNNHTRSPLPDSLIFEISWLKSNWQKPCSIFFSRNPNTFCVALWRRWIWQRQFARAFQLL